MTIQSEVAIHGALPIEVRRKYLQWFATVAALPREDAEEKWRQAREDDNGAPSSLRAHAVRVAIQWAAIFHSRPYGIRTFANLSAKRLNSSIEL